MEIIAEVTWRAFAINQSINYSIIFETQRPNTLVCRRASRRGCRRLPHLDLAFGCSVAALFLDCLMSDSWRAIDIIIFRVNTYTYEKTLLQLMLTQYCDGLHGSYTGDRQGDIMATVTKPFNIHHHSQSWVPKWSAWMSGLEPPNHVYMC